MVRLVVMRLTLVGVGVVLAELLLAGELVGRRRAVDGGAAAINSSIVVVVVAGV